MENDMKVSDLIKMAHDFYANRIFELIKENEELKPYKDLYIELANEGSDIVSENVRLWNKVKDLEKVIKCYERNGTPF